MDDAHRAGAERSRDLERDIDDLVHRARLNDVVALDADVVTEVKLLQINGSTFDQMLRNNPEIAVRMIKKLAERLAAAKLRAIVTREPGGSPGAEIMRHLVLSGMGKLLGPDAETLLFAAARDDHVRTVIQPALGQGTWVLCDRFSDSTRAYQGRLGQVAPGVLNAMQRVTIGDLKPDLTIILDIPVEVGLQRAAARRGSGVPDRFESEDLQFHQDLRDAYRQIAAEDGAGGRRELEHAFLDPLAASRGMLELEPRGEPAVAEPELHVRAGARRECSCGAWCRARARRSARSCGSESRAADPALPGQEPREPSGVDDRGRRSTRREIARTRPAACAA